MKKRQIIILASALAILLVGYGGCSLLAGMRKVPERKTNEPIARLVKVQVIQNDTLIRHTPLNGKLVVKEKLEVFPEVTGTLIGGSHPYKVGQVFKQGEVLLQIDGRESQLNLQAQRSSFINAVAQVLPDIKIDFENQFNTWKTYLQELEADKALPALPSTNDEQLKNFLSGRNLYQQYYSIKSLEERQSKFAILAPFDGVVSMGDAHLGTLLRSGQKVGEFIRTDQYELEAAVPVEDAVDIEVGDMVRMHFKGQDKTYTGKVVRVAANVDPMNQRVAVYASMSGEGLKEGIYLEGYIAVAEVNDASTIKRNLIRSRNEVLIVADSALQLQAVEVIDLQGDEAIVKGLSNGTLLLNQFIEGAYQGMPVQIEKERS